MAGHYLMFATGTSIAYAESIDTVPVNLQEVRPTLVLSVPRLYEKMFARVLETALTGGFLKKNIFFWGRGVADRWANEKLAGREPGGLLAQQYSIAQKLVFSKLKARTGGRLRYFVSGGAPLSPDINKFFFAAGLTILEGYGLTETSPVIAVNTPQNFRIGTVGKLVDGVEVKIADDGEILTRGPYVMKGYFNKPDATREAIDPDGWFHTGDIGELNDGFLAITDRKKDIIVTAGGKNLAPQNIENALKMSRFVSQALVLGDRRPYVTALITLDEAELPNSGPPEPLVQELVDGVNRDLSRFEQIKRFAIVPREFSADEGEVTPTLKLKRRVIEERFAAEIERLYEP
jgi:long-chain acyl-CoA synthetase